MRRLGKRGEADSDAEDNPLNETVLYTLLAVIFFVTLYLFVASYQRDAFLWESFYAQEIGLVINSAQPGDEFYIDVTKATAIAQKSGKVSMSDIFTFDNVNHEVRVSLRPGSVTRFSFFNDVAVIDYDLELVSGAADVNRLYFKIEERDNES